MIQETILVRPLANCAKCFQMHVIYVQRLKVIFILMEKTLRKA